MSKDLPNYGQRPAEPDGWLSRWFARRWLTRRSEARLDMASLASERTSVVTAAPETAPAGMLADWAARSATRKAQAEIAKAAYRALAASEKRKAWAIYFGVMAALVGALVTSIVVAPIYYSEGLFVSFLSVTLPTAIISWAGWPDVVTAFATINQRNGNVRQQSPWFWPTAVFSVLTVLLWTANRVFDHSPPTVGIYSISGKHQDTDRHGESHFRVDVVVAVPPLLGLSFGPIVTINIAEQGYNLARPGVSALELRVHPGRFYLPWREQKMRLIVVSPALQR